MILSAIVVAVAYALRWYTHHGDHPAPDSRRYLAMARGLPQPSPFHRRWLLPRIIGTPRWRWRVVTFASTVACGPLLVALTGSPWAGALFAVSPLVNIAAGLPVLLDMPAMALALGSAVAWQHGSVRACVALAMAAGSVREPAPVLLSAIAGTPWALLGLFGVGWYRRQSKPDADVYVGRPLKQTALRIRNEHHHEPLSIGHALAWGPLLVLVPLGAAWDRATLLACIAVAIAYAQLVIATDKARLYLWAMPAVLPLAVRAVDARWLCVACVVYALLPYREV